MTKKRCVCQICSCGRHKCPHNPSAGFASKTSEPCSFSEYANTYRQHPVELRKNYKPVEQPIRHEEPMDGWTTSRVDYKMHPLEKPQRKPNEVYKRPEGDLDLKTIYAQQYTQRPAERAKPVRHEEPRQEPAKFDGANTYKVDYPQWNVPRQEKVTAPNNYLPPTTPFEGKTRYKSDFPMHGRTPRESFKPVENTIRSDVPFEGMTEARKSYVQHAVPRREVREKPTWEPSTARMDGWSTSRKDYGPKEAIKQPSYKPEAIPFRSTDPFDGSSTQRADFVNRPMEPVRRREPEPYRRPEGDLDHNTTAKMAYTRKPMEKTNPIRPHEQHIAPGKFEGTTTARAEYPQWGPGERPQKLKREYVPSEGPFEGKPSYQMDYPAHRGAPKTNPIRPMEREYTKGGPLDTTTEYKKQYIQKKTDSCHVPLLDKDKGKALGYEYSEVDESGHRWYSLNNTLFVATAAGKFLQSVDDD